MFPSVSIGVPVHNAERYLRLALDSLVSQDYPNFEIHVSDNASTDSTWCIVQEYAERNDRFRLHRWSHNVGAVRNFQHVLLDSDTKYFMWAAFDDIWSPDFISKAVSVFRSDQAAVMVNAITVLIDEQGNVLPDIPTRPQLVDLKDVSFVHAVKQLALRVGWCIYGLIDRSALLKTSVFSDQEVAHDVVLTYELASMGNLRVIEDTPFYYRLVPKSTSVVAAQLQVLPAAMEKPFTRLFKGCIRVIAASSTDGGQSYDACRVFIEVCAHHDEWWAAIRSENCWGNPSLSRERVELLRCLAGID